MPGIRLALFEKSGETDWRVGESTVELASNYLIRRLGLSRYLYEEQLPKNGLRYFFDDEAKSLPLAEMSEIGSVNLPFHPAFQIDRARLDADLRRMNAEAGAELHVGATVQRLELGEGGAPHRFEVREDGRTRAVECRWLADASGRAGLVARAKGLRVKDVGHRIAAVWGRFENVADIDDLGPESFRARVRHTSRGLSTVHFCYPGYWIWFIPIRNGVISVGVVGDPPRDDPGHPHARGLSRLPRRPRDGARAAARRAPPRHPELRPARLRDHPLLPRRSLGHDGRVRRLRGPALQPRRRLHRPRERLPHGSRAPGTSRGEGAEALAERCELYDRFMRFRFEAAMLLYRDQYAMLGSQELMRLKWDFDLALYYNLWVSAYMQDLHLDARWLRRELRQEPFVLQAMRNFAALFEKARRKLLDEGDLPSRQPRRLLLRPRVHRLRRGGRAARARAGRCSRRPARSSTRSTCAPASCSASPTTQPPAEAMPLTSFMVDRPLA